MFVTVTILIIFTMGDIILMTLLIPDFYLQMTLLITVNKKHYAMLNLLML
jgi:hypothetical protein